MTWRSFLNRKNALWLAVALVAVEVFSVLPPRLPPPAPAPDAPPYSRGAIHIHSIYSHDSEGTIEEIAEAARSAGLDFIVITDHLNVQAKREGKETTINGVDILVEAESSVRVGHIITFYSDTPALKIPDLELNEMARHQIFDGRRIHPDVFQIIAHPTSLKHPWDRLDLLSEGIEVINFDSQWRSLLDEMPANFLGTVMLAPFNQYLAALRFVKIRRKDFEIWDHMNAISKAGHFSILAHDTHSKLPLPWSGKPLWSPYATMFRLASNVLFLDGERPPSLPERKAQLYRSLRAGRLALIIDAIHPFPGNDWTVRCGNRTHRAGDRVSAPALPCEAEVRVPPTFPYAREIQLWKDGQLIATEPETGAGARFKIEAPGAYRVEVWAKPRTWLGLGLGEPVPYLFYNPIYLR